VITIATHNGSIHTDDVFGVAVLQAVLETQPSAASQAPSVAVARTRDATVIPDADYAVDVGGE
jgi:uncharacterized UPF0160 family protein